jgi:hypothetical protein
LGGGKQKGGGTTLGGRKQKGGGLSSGGGPNGQPTGVISTPGKTKSTSVPGLKLLGAINSLESDSGPGAGTLWLGLASAIVVLGAPALLLAGRRRGKGRLIPARAQEHPRR